jgi:hypothetical protein
VCCGAQTRKITPGEEDEDAALLTVLTFGNLGILMSLLIQIRPVEANDAAPILRGCGLEIVDGQGKVRASIQVVPAVPARRADGSLLEANGKIYPEAVLLRLIRPDGRPSVKIETSKEGSGLDLGGGSDSSYIVLKADGADTSISLTNKDGRRQVVKP